MNDLKFAFRQLGNSPGFTLVAVLTLALGIGANTAIFSVVEGVLLRPLPFPNAERLVRIYEALDENGARSGTLNLSDRTVARFREFGRDIFEDVAGGTGGASVVSAKAGSPAQTVPAASITYNFFDVLGLPPSQGRNFTTEEGTDNAANVVIISDDFWRNNLNSRRDVLGSTIVIDGTPRTIIGVMPKAFRHPYRASLWLPLVLEPDNPATINNHYLYGVARLRPGITPAKAEEAVKRMCATINRDDPNPANVRAAYIPPLRESFVMDLRPKILVIVGAAVCALLIAAANFAGLLLARVIEREGEFALRAALGASRRQLVRQQLIQALLLALAGTALGLLIAFWITPMLFALSPEGADATGSAMREFDYAARLLGSRTPGTIGTGVASLIAGRVLVETLTRDLIADGSDLTNTGFSFKYPSYRQGLPPTLEALGYRLAVLIEDATKRETAAVKMLDSGEASRKLQAVLA